MSDNEPMTDGVQPDDDIPVVDNTKRNWLVGGGAVAAIIAGALYFGGADPVWSDANDPASVEELAAVEADSAAVEAEPEPEPATDARGVIKAKKESTVASKMTARITQMPFGKGRSFRRGALLARFDCSAIQAQLNAARASSNAYKVTYETNVELDEYEAIGKNEVAVAKANLGRAQAEASAIRAQMSDCAVYAPFSGTVVEQIASRGEVAASGQPLLTIQSGGDLESEIIVPSNWLTWLRPGVDFTFAVDETGAEISGTIVRLGASVDPVSKTIRVTGNLAASDSLVLPGMSGTATFVKPEPEPEEPEAVVPAEGAEGAKPASEATSGQQGT